jgi:hypothetical protein
MPPKTLEYVTRTTPDLVREQVERLKKTFPECVSEGRVDFARLRATLGDSEENKRFFYKHFARRDEIHQEFGVPLEWQQKEGVRVCRICHTMPGAGLRDREEWPALQEKMIDAMVRLEEALRPHIGNIK